MFYAHPNTFIYKDNNQEYVGFYNILNGLFYTGMKFELNISRELRRLVEFIGADPSNLTNNISTSDVSFKPVKHIATPSADDYENGSFVRYFCKHKLNNPTEILEIDRFTYNRILNSEKMPEILYETTEIEWVISNFGGYVDIEKVNFKSIGESNKKFRGITQYFTNLKEFSKF